MITDNLSLSGAGAVINCNLSNEKGQGVFKVQLEYCMRDDTVSLPNSHRPRKNI